ncbi:MAG: hypothetical protein HETSPECPRED_004973 [Heterodermia speciosa]|uniref:RING-type domain-containing protein n=1 Tax=Heterodermia speciosa TaxID=116794 RepID=A0A8H3EHG7_9LECA|nr:MAG: hypothetical protein HETSPECPRED_004973 [Heterodermia speciosa]
MDFSGSMLDEWIDKLFPIGEDERRKDNEYCPCCKYVHRRHQHLPPWKLPQYYDIVELPCGCRDRRGCLARTIRKDDWNGKCPICITFRLFKEWTLDEWLDYLPTVQIESLQETDRECSICLTPYGQPVDLSKSQNASSSSRGRPEHPIRLRCEHVLGSRCIKKWLSPKSERGSEQNTCPICRKELFSAWPNPEDDDFEDDEFEEEGEYEEEEQEAQPENEDENWEAYHDRGEDYVFYEWVESDSEDEEDQYGKRVLWSTGWRRQVWSKGTYVPCSPPEHSRWDRALDTLVGCNTSEADSDPEDEEEEEEEEDEDKEDDEDEEENEEEEDEAHDGEEPDDQEPGDEENNAAEHDHEAHDHEDQGDGEHNHEEDALEEYYHEEPEGSDEEYQADDEEPEEDSEEYEEDDEALEEDELEHNPDVTAEEATPEETEEGTEQTTVPQAGPGQDSEADLEEIEPDPELRARAERLQRTRKRERDEEAEGDLGLHEGVTPRAQRQRLH